MKGYTDKDFIRRPAKHPMQPVVNVDGIHRYKQNAIVRYLLDRGNIDLNQIAILPFSQEDREQFAQLIGYSVGGACDLDYMSNRICNRALRASERMND